MSGRGPPEGPKSGRSQGSQGRNPAAFGAGRGSGGRSTGPQLAQGRGNGLPGVGQQAFGPDDNGMSYSGALSGGYNAHGGEGKPAPRAASAATHGRGVTLPQGVNPVPTSNGIRFGQFGSMPTEDGNLTVEHLSPQQSERSMSAADQNRSGGRSGPAGRGLARQNGARNAPKPNTPNGQAMPNQPGGFAGSPLAFGSGVPPMGAYMQQAPQYAAGYQPYSGYGVNQVASPAFQPGYQGYPAAVYQMNGYPQQYQAQQPPAYHQQPSYRGVPQPQYQGSQRQPPYNETKPSIQAPSERKSKALSIMDPNTNKPVVVEGRPLTAPPAPGPGTARKQPSQGSPTPKPGNGQLTGLHSGPVVPVTRQLHITAPPQKGGPSKASQQLKMAKTPATVLTTPTPQPSLPKQLAATKEEKPASAPIQATANGTQSLDLDQTAAVDAPKVQAQTEEPAKLADEATAVSRTDTKEARPISKADTSYAAAAKAVTAAASTLGDKSAEAVKQVTNQAAVHAEAANEAAAKQKAEEAEQKRLADEKAAVELKEEELKAAERKAAEQREAQQKAHQAAEEERRKTEDAAAKQKAQEEAAAKKRAAEEAAAAKKKADEEAAAKRKADEEAAAKRRAAEEAATKRQAEEETAAKRRADEEAAQKRQADEQAAAKRKADEEQAAKRKAEAKSTADPGAKDAAGAQDIDASAASSTAAAPEANDGGKAESDADKAAAETASTLVSTAKETSGQAAVPTRVPSDPAQEESSLHPPSSSSNEEAASNHSVAPPKRKGKKALFAAIERKEKETESYDGREVDMSAYKEKAAASQQADGHEAPPAPIATPEPKAEVPKASSSASAEDDDDWEDKKIETPRAAPQPAKDADSDQKKYSRDFLMTINKAIEGSVHEWPGLEHFRGDSFALLRGAEADIRGGRGGGGYMRGPPAHTGRGAGGGEDRWARKALPPQAGFVQPPGMGPPPPPRGMGGRGAPARGIEGDRWARGTALPPMPQGGRSVPALHKANNRYERGKLISENPEEERKQKEIKSLLNKITPEKFDIIMNKIVALEFDSVLSLRGLIDQIFDKALLEMTFSEIYANLCQALNKLLPEFPPEEGSEDNKAVNLRRVLVNKCQEEFEEGAAAITAVKMREQTDAENAGKEEEHEEGEISQEEKLEKRKQDARDAEAEQKARRRALGNIQFIGQLYKKRMLTEKIMHSCIQTLLEEVDTPRREDIECLCKLMSTIGAQLDASSKSQVHMAAYFQRLETMTKLPDLEVRLKFMIQDVIDLRHNRWQERRKVEGPKTIEEIHRDARAEQFARPARGPPERGGRGGHFREPLPPPRQPLPMRARHEDRLEDKPRPMQRTPSQEGIFAPGGRGSGGFRPGGSLASRGTSPAETREPSPLNASAPPQPPSRPAAESKAPQPAAAPAGPPLSTEETKTKAAGILREYVQLRSTAEAEAVISQELAPGQADFALVVETWLTVALEEKGIDTEATKDLFDFTASKGLIPGKAFEGGLTAVLNQLHDTAVDAPFAPKLVGQIIGRLLAANVLDLPNIGNAILKAGSEEAEEGGEPLLIDQGYAAPVMATALHEYAEKASKDTALSVWNASGLQLDQFFAKYEDAKSKASVVERHAVAAFA